MCIVLHNTCIVSFSIHYRATYVSLYLSSSVLATGCMDSMGILSENVVSVSTVSGVTMCRVEIPSRCMST